MKRKLLAKDPNSNIPATKRILLPFPLFDNPRLKIILSLLIGLGFVGAGFAQDHSGYYSRFGKRGKVRIVESFKCRDNIRISFNLSVDRVKSSPYLRNLSGTAKFINRNTFEYNGDLKNENAKGCRLTFIFSGNRLNIREIACLRFDGASSSFEGFYRKK